MDLVLDMEDNRIWSPGERKIGKISVLPPKALEKLRGWFVKFIASMYVGELQEAIKDQRYAHAWIPLSPQWLKLKEEMGWSENIWEATGHLLESISFWRTSKGWVVGVDPKAKYRGKKFHGQTLSVRLVALWMEYGTGERAEGGKGTPGHPGMPPRPLFRPLRERMRRDMSRWWSIFLDEFGEEVDVLLANSMAERSV